MLTALIIGTHPIRRNIIGQYESAGFDAVALPSFDAVQSIDGVHEICIVPSDDQADQDTLKALDNLAERFPVLEADATKPICHLMLHNRVSLWLLQTIDVYQNIHEKFELYAFTMEDQWAKNVLCHHSHIPIAYPPLDRERIDIQSDKTVHLVIYGLGEMSESLALHTALTAHYPNYNREHSLRTRITIIDEHIAARKNAIIQRYKYLFDHSFYRTIDLEKQSTTLFHEPIFNATREDFIDVEWEFVEGDLYDPAVQQKLRLWAHSREQLFTLALCKPDCQTNFDNAFTLPNAIFQNRIPVLVYVKQDDFINKVRNTPGYQNLYPFGMETFGYDIRLPLLQMAKRLNYCYACSYGEKGIPTEMPVDDIEKEWRKLKSFNMRYANIYNVMTLATKMRSLGHLENDWSKFYDLTQEEVQQISAVEHNRWSVERLILGYRPPTDTERQEIKENIEAFITARKTGQEPPKEDLKNIYKKRKIHYDLCSNRELREDKSGQNVRVYDYDLSACIPLIAQSFNETQS